MKSLFPEIKGKRLQSNSTHVAILVGNEIQIWLIGFSFKCDDGSEYVSLPEKLWVIPAEEEEDLFAIFERLDEDNRINVAEANEEFGRLFN